ncbi:MAG: 30S ribosomal protein S20 [Omnitrophica WOR_2 bacterium GWF2_38_59]|nr:MAG: 30S ribosomal protein S20 [Omnitrophica WOR_2 bacterium GWA2_37_7]OGX22086.1 MAG: 30S ribosomal protein S20 [Omnitrophica WOR_2 bacterium GWF2_38_59]OGX46728.1 MAG: 30S ribosomal protein S20 [Omnitrophica WOR_2 bacterium RIFOXYA2_FULL_38_17]OGX53420.1 MAG: 30S ribosomal protein S20 [Omnitrophica WOR_2 bacterium RIFOXYA12_FULL_38_10]OGX56599.1 MAG: 30S ribosomal protein S20 [Omnitrophica WOR_2 bacterium RIFOXYC2_FULL_38_12]OGX59818.1 MAG: 30S ribosomal protein S20 [Omnitrophica WOR_2 ba
MPQRRSGLKELRKNRTNRMHNLDIKTDLKKTIKKYTSSIEKNNAAEAKENLKTVYKKIDKASKRNIISKNTASRRKSMFSKKITKLA